jgi:hypothetical protein
MKNFALAVLLIFFSLAPALAQMPVVVAPQGATSADAQPNGTVTFQHPWIDNLQPYVLTIAAALTPLIVAAAALGVAFLQAKTNAMKSQELKNAAVQTAVKDAGGNWYANGTVASTDQPVQATDTDVADLAKKALAQLPADNQISLGLMQHKIAGEIGNLQAIATSAGPPPTK